MLRFGVPAVHELAIDLDWEQVCAFPLLHSLRCLLPGSLLIEFLIVL